MAATYDQGVYDQGTYDGGSGDGGRQPQPPSGRFAVAHPVSGRWRAPQGPAGRGWRDHRDRHFHHQANERHEQRLLLVQHSGRHGGWHLRR